MFRSQKDKRKKEEQEVLMKRRASMLDRYQKVFDKLEENRDDIEDNFERLTTSSAQQDQELTKVVDAIKGAQGANNRMTKTLNDIIVVLKKQSELFDTLKNPEKTGITEEQLEQLQKIVEKSNLADSPQKKLSTLDRKYEDTYQDMSDLVKAIERLDDQMSVNSLNTAVEAQKVGPRGRKLIRAAEDVRSLSEDYTETAKNILDIFNSFSEVMDETRERVDALAECVQEQTNFLEQFLQEQQDSESSFSYGFDTEEREETINNSYDYEDEYEKHYGSDDFDDEYEKHYGTAEDVLEEEDENEQTLEEQNVSEENIEQPETEVEESKETEPVEEKEEEKEEEEITFAMDMDGDIHSAIEGLQEVINMGKKTSEHHQDAVRQMISAGETFMEQQKVMQRLENLYETVSENVHQVYKETQSDDEEMMQ